MADCESRGERLANVYSDAEQADLNTVITNAGGTDRAFWLGMIEDGDQPEKTGIKVGSNYESYLGFMGFIRILMEIHLDFTMDGELISHQTDLTIQMINIQRMKTKIVSVNLA